VAMPHEVAAGQL